MRYWGNPRISFTAAGAHAEPMSALVLVIALLIVLSSPFRRCVLIMPIVMAGLVAGLGAREALWKATGGEYGDCTDVCFEPHLPGTASPLFTPLWTLALVAIVSLVVGLSVLVVRSSLERQRRRNPGRESAASRSNSD